MFEFDGLGTQSLALPVTVVSDEVACIVKICVGNTEPDSAFVLSDNCVAEVKGSELAGFTVRLPPLG